MGQQIRPLTEVHFYPFAQQSTQRLGIFATHWNLYPKTRARKMQEASMKERGILSLGLAVILFVFGIPRAFAQLDELKNTTPGERASL